MYFLSMIVSFKMKRGRKGVASAVDFCLGHEGPEVKDSCVRCIWVNGGVLPCEVPCQMSSVEADRIIGEFGLHICCRTNCALCG